MKPRKPLKRTPFKRTKATLEKLKAWKRHSKPINKVNRERRKRLYVKQFGDKSEWVRAAFPFCMVSGKQHGLEMAHVERSRGAGGDSTHILLLHWKVHRDFDSGMTDEKFEAKHGRSRDWVRRQAIHIHDSYLRDGERG